MTDDSHESSLKRFDLPSFSEKSLEIFVYSSLLELELLVLMFRALQLLVKLVYLAVGEVELLLSTFNVSENVVVRLVSAI